MVIKFASIETNTYFNEGFKRFFHNEHLTTWMIILRVKCAALSLPVVLYSYINPTTRLLIYKLFIGHLWLPWMNVLFRNVFEHLKVIYNLCMYVFSCIHVSVVFLLWDCYFTVNYKIGSIVFRWPTKIIFMPNHRIKIKHLFCFPGGLWTYKVRAYCSYRSTLREVV